MIEQILIAATGVTAVFLSQQSNQRLKRFAPIFGIIGQPFWFYSSYVNQQWGIFVLCFFYSYSWCLGLYNQWLGGSK